MQVNTVHSFDRFTGTFSVLQGNETKATRAARARIIHNNNLLDWSNAAKLVLEVALSRANAQAEGADNVGRWWRGV